MLQLKCYDGTDPDCYRQKIEEKDIQIEDETELYNNNPAMAILRRIVTHSLTLSFSEHVENMEELVKVNWLLVEREGQKKSREFHDVLSQSFGYYFKKNEKKHLLKCFMRSHLGFDIKLFFRLFSAIIRSEEERHHMCVSEQSNNPMWVQTVQRIEYITRCDTYIKRCENKVRNRTLNYLKKVLLDRANSRFKKHIETIPGDLDRPLFKK